MIDDIATVTDEALQQVNEPRFLRTERGFQGRFYCALQRALEKRGLLQDGRILEMEYQKSARHGLSQRPDILLHVPAEESGANVTENNLAVWALKRRARLADVQDDFNKLDDMFERLCYPVGIFINIDTTDHFAASYRGMYPDRLRTVGVWLDGEIRTTWGRPQRGRHAA